MSEANAKQQIVGKIKDSSNILVTVSSNPSVDELSAALGLTLLINKFDKHATAIFSGETPPAITFLDPNKTFENTVDSLRDFIIALDKEKADHLRYKVEGDVVKIFITPYRTVINDQDLEFSQGDYNVEMVIAIGVPQPDDLDKALAAHGQILDDATVATLSIGESASTLGSINWQEKNASSYCEMVADIAEVLKREKVSYDGQIATALLTGIVASTDRFSNNKTSSRVMTVAASLMAAGANQQLIAAKLEEAEEIAKQPEETEVSDESQNAKATKDASSQDDGSKRLKEGELNKLESETTPPPKDDGSLVISHDDKPEADPKEGLENEEDQNEPQSDQYSTEAELERQRLKVEKRNQSASRKHAEEMLKNGVERDSQDTEALELPETPEAPIPEPTTPPPPTEPPETHPPETPTPETQPPETSAPEPPVEPEYIESPLPPETMAPPAGPPPPPPVTTIVKPALPASPPPLEPTETDNPANNPFLRSVDKQPAFSATVYGGDQEEESVPDIFSYQETPSGPTPPIAQPSADSGSVTQTLADLDRENRGKPSSSSEHDEARNAVESALNASSSNDSPAGTTPLAPIGPPPPLAELPPLPDFSTLPPLPGSQEPIQVSESGPTDNKLEDILPPAPAPAAPVASDPAQFKIPGQN